MGNLQQDPDAVPCFSLAVFSGAVLQMRHDLQRVFYGIVRFLPLNIDNGSDSAVIVFKSRVV